MEYLVLFGMLAAIFVVAGFFIQRHNRRQSAQAFARNESLFASMFPDLQPYYHPKKVLEFVRARLAQAPARGGMRMKSPPGFAVPMAEVSFDTDGKGRERELWVLLDEAGRELSRFFFESDANDGMVRVGLLHYNTAEEVDRLLEALAELE